MRSLLSHIALTKNKPQYNEYSLIIPLSRLHDNLTSLGLVSQYETKDRQYVTLKTLQKISNFQTNPVKERQRYKNLEVENPNIYFLDF